MTKAALAPLGRFKMQTLCSRLHEIVTKTGAEGRIVDEHAVLEGVEEAPIVHVDTPNGTEIAIDDECLGMKKAWKIGINFDACLEDIAIVGFDGSLHPKAMHPCWHHDLDAHATLCGGLQRL